MALLLKNLLFTALVPGTVAVYVPLMTCMSRSPASGPLLIFAVCVLAAGAAVYICCIWDFASFGRGTPMPIDAPERLVIRGPYRYTRNPMYVSVLAVILGWAIFFGAVFLIVYGVVVAVCFHLFIVFYEEPHLRRKFERDYEQYCSRVGRWLPKFKG